MVLKDFPIRKPSKLSGEKKKDKRGCTKQDPTAKPRKLGNPKVLLRRTRPNDQGDFRKRGEKKATGG